MKLLKLLYLYAPAVVTAAWALLLAAGVGSTGFTVFALVAVAAGTWAHIREERRRV